ALQNGFAQLVKVQGMFTLILIVFARDLLRPLGLGAVQIGVFQVTALGVFLLVLFLSLMTILFYLSKLFDAMICCLVFALTNGLVTFWSISGGERWYGFGFFLASGVATFLAVVLVNQRLALLEYDTFTSQTLRSG
ncbi:MAG TPA: exopolysaccharide Pel transporter PelG, partial [Verrucomicrobiae bacterium]|nr:exopolysaccharide Pel transporter PelG [Verrucomicrobiae bacterium]